MLGLLVNFFFLSFYLSLSFLPQAIGGKKVLFVCLGKMANKANHRTLVESIGYVLVRNTFLSYKGLLWTHTDFWCNKGKGFDGWHTPGFVNTIAGVSDAKWLSCGSQGLEGGSPVSPKHCSSGEEETAWIITRVSPLAGSRKVRWLLRCQAVSLGGEVTTFKTVLVHMLAHFHCVSTNVVWFGVKINVPPLLSNQFIGSGGAPRTFLTRQTLESEEL